MDIPRVGIELEGVGHVWATFGAEKKHLGFLFGNKPKHFRRSKNKEFVKKQSLVSFDPDEDVPGEFTVHAEPLILGHQMPAELVSSPFPRDNLGVKGLRTAFLKAMATPRRSSTTNTGAALLPPHDSVDVDAKFVKKPDYGLGGLQTTVGIPAASLLSDNSDERETLIEYLITDKGKRAVTKTLLDQAVRAQQFLMLPPAPTAANASSTGASMGGPETGDAGNGAVGSASASVAASAGDAAPAVDVGDSLSGEHGPEDSKYRMRLALLMAFMHREAGNNNLTPGALQKDTFGLNIKGYSSTKGVGLEEGSPEARALAELSSDPSRRESLLTHLGVKEEDWGDRFVDRKLKRGWQSALKKVGSSGLSSQVAYEKGTPIPNFIHEDRLHTVIESRESNSPINEDMRLQIDSKSDSFLRRAAFGRLTRPNLAVAGEIRDGRGSAAGRPNYRLGASSSSTLPPATASRT